MLFKSHILEQIKSGRITIAFRRWKKPTAKAGGRLRTPIGELAIQNVQVIAPNTITDADAQLAGYADAASVLKEISKNAHTAKADPVYKITFVLAGEDTRIALRNDDNLDETQLANIKANLDRLDSAASNSPDKSGWTRQTLTIISQMPEQPARLLADAIGMQTEPFKINVRKLKNLGLTQSLGTGYKLSPRGEVVLKVLIDNKT